MKVFLINRSDVLFFSGETKLKVKKENGREFIDAPVLQDGKIVLRIIPRYSRFDYALDCNVILYSGQTQDIWLRFNHFVNKKSSIPVAAVTVPEGTVATLENAAYVYDKASCRRRKVYKLVSWLMRVAVIVAVVVAVCFMII